MFIHLPTRIPMYMFSKAGWVEREGRKEGKREETQEGRKGEKGKEGGRGTEEGREEGYLTDQKLLKLLAY